jgi:hypothetical protein
LIKGKNKENRWEVKNTSDKPRNHGMQDVSIRVCDRHIILSDLHGSERHLSETRLEFKELFGIGIYLLAVEAKTPSGGVSWC